jgi:signal transduction histidine kinase
MGGEERETVAVATPDLGELSRLMETFQRATENLSQSYRRIGELQEEIAEKDRRLARKTRLETLGRMAATLAHEIRNPLGGIQLFASMLRRDLQADADKVRVLDRILGAVAGLDSLVEDMLEYGRDLEPRKVRRPLAPVVEAALDLARAALEGRRVELDVEGEADVDAEMMGRAFLNLALNAAQAMGPGGTLSVRGRGGEVAFADTGPGIPAEVLGRLFTPFTTTKTKGTGLGLAIARRIVEAHGGAIEARNREEGGAVFTVRL